MATRKKSLPKPKIKKQKSPIEEKLKGTPPGGKKPTRKKR
jgi:hypothetical protein